MTIDWNKPIEAIHRDGRIANAVLRRVVNDSGMALVHRIGDVSNGVDQDAMINPDGSYHYQRNGWIIRNRKPTPSTATERLERLEAFVARLAAAGVSRKCDCGAHGSSAAGEGCPRRHQAWPLPRAR